MPSKKFSTSTKLGQEIVPWLAARGELAYSPNDPPDKDYYFQYSWVIPDIFKLKKDKRKHFWFGEYYKDDPKVQLLFSFWNSARMGDRDQLFLSKGTVIPEKVTAPIAAYRYKRNYFRYQDSLILIQHGSYLIADINSQPGIERGEVILYRGVQDSKIFKFYRLADPEIRLKLLNVHKETLTDSVDSFNAVHCNVARSETGFLNDRNPMFSEIAMTCGLQVESESVKSLLYSGYALEECKLYIWSCGDAVSLAT